MNHPKNVFDTVLCWVLDRCEVKDNARSFEFSDGDPIGALYDRVSAVEIKDIFQQFVVILLFEQRIDALSSQCIFSDADKTRKSGIHVPYLACMIQNKNWDGNDIEPIKWNVSAHGSKFTESVS